MIILLIFFLIKGFDLEYLVQRVQCTSHIANNQCHERYFHSAESCKTSWGAPQLLFSLLVLRLWITHQNLSIVCLHSCLHYLQTVTFNLWLLGLISWLISLSVCSFPAAAAESHCGVQSSECILSNLRTNTAAMSDFSFGEHLFQSYLGKFPPDLQFSCIYIHV